MRLAGALLLVTSTALAEPAVSPNVGERVEARFAFEWLAPAGCPSRGDVLERAEQLVGHGLAPATSAPRVELSATVQSTAGSGWQLAVASGASGTSWRTVDAPSCDELADAMALLIAFSVDPEYEGRALNAGSAPPQSRFGGTSREGTQPSSPASDTAVVPAPARLQIHVMPRKEQPGSLLQGSLGALGALWFGRLPGVAPGVVVRGAVSRQWFVFGLELGFFPQQHVAKHGVAADLWLATLGGTLGYELFDGVLTPYAGLELDLLHGVGSGVSAPASGQVWLLGLDLGVLLRYPVRPSLSLLVSARLSALSQQARFHIDPDVELFRPQPLGAQLGLGAEVTIR
jgi:hypothetical protein